VKFLADMGISTKTVAFLHGLGHDAVHLSEQGLERLPDAGIVEKARQEGRIVLVHDLGVSPPQYASRPCEGRAAKYYLPT
jgi:predicted nuclease of predicted toxin-antitoxin system